MSGWGAGSELMGMLAKYGAARREFLAAIGCRPDSMREPLAEFSELLVAALTGERLADSPVQRGWDLIAADGTTTQVRYLANPKNRWVNGHQVTFTPGLDRYALVVYEALEPVCVLIFDGNTLGAVCTRLGKRHPNQDRTLQLTQANVRRLLADREVFAEVGVKVLP